MVMFPFTTNYQISGLHSHQSHVKIVGGTYRIQFLHSQLSTLLRSSRIQHSPSPQPLADLTRVFTWWKCELYRAAQSGCSWLVTLQTDCFEAAPVADPTFNSAMYSLQRTHREQLVGSMCKTDGPWSGRRCEKGNLTVIFWTRTCSNMSHAHRTCERETIDILHT